MTLNDILCEGYLELAKPVGTSRDRWRKPAIPLGEIEALAAYLARDVHSHALEDSKIRASSDARDAIEQAEAALIEAHQCIASAIALADRDWENVW